MERKRAVFCSYRCFLESENLRCEKFSVSERNFLFTCDILSSFFQFLWLRGFGNDLNLFIADFGLIFAIF